MRWSAILAPLRHSHSASLSCATLNRRDRAPFSTLPRKFRPQRGPSPTALPSQEQPRSSAQSLVIANSSRTPPAHVTEIGSGSSCQAPIRSSSKTVTISEDEDGSFKSGTGQGSSSSTARPYLNISTGAERAGPSTSEAVKREAVRREAFYQVNDKRLEVSHVQVNPLTKASCAQVTIAEGHGYVARASFSTLTKHSSIINTAKNSTSVVNPRNGKASLSEVKGAEKFERSADNFASASTIKSSPSQTEGTATPRALAYESLSKTETNRSTTQVGERLAGVAHGAVRLGNVSSSAEEDAFVGAVALSEDVGLSADIAASSTHGSSEHPEGSAALQGKNKAGSKKSFAVSFPVTVFTEWWFSCFLQWNRPYYTSLKHPLNKVYVWLVAYQRAHYDATGQYADGPNSAVLMQQLLNLLNAVLEGKFRWGDKNFVYLSEPAGYNEEHLSNVIPFPSFQDRVVHEILHLVLEPIFEARFSARSHGSRPGRDAHTALRAAQRSFQGCTWFINGNVSFLHEEKYASHLVDAAFRFVRDTRVTFLLKSGFLEGMSEKEGSTCACVFPDKSKLRNLLCNALLDHLDWLMDEQISSLSKKEQPTSRSSSGLLFKSERVIVERQRKLKYLRYGTEFLVACNGTREEAEPVRESIINFFKQKFNVDLGNMLTINHISNGVQFLDHVISQKIAHPIFSCRRASGGRVFEKRAHRIRLCINASKECCLMHLKKIKAPTSLQHIEEMLSILDNWYHYAENKEKVMQFCKLTLCHLYAKGVIKEKEEELMDFDEQFKEALRMVAYGQAKSVDSPNANLMPDFFWIPEHENALRAHAVLQSKSSMVEAAASFKNLRMASPRQQWSRVLWQYIGGSYGGLGDNSGESEIHMQISSPGQEFVVDTKLEDFAQSVG